MNRKYQICGDRGNGLETEGPWTSSDDERWFSAKRDAIAAARHLKTQYDDVRWVVCDADDRRIFSV